MERILNAVLFSLISMATAAAIGAQEQPPQRGPAGAGGEGNEVLRCIYTPAADSQSSSLPSSKLGIKFLLQRNNSNHIAADTYTLNDSNQPIKQVGHAELTGSVSEITATTKAAEIISGLALAEDSPFDFQITLDSTAADGNGRLGAIVESMTTFTGEIYTQVPVSCKIPPAPQQKPPAAQREKSKLN